MCDFARIVSVVDPKVLLERYTHCVLKFTEGVYAV